MTVKKKVIKKADKKRGSVSVKAKKSSKKITSAKKTVKKAKIAKKIVKKIAKKPAKKVAKVKKTIKKVALKKSQPIKKAKNVVKEKKLVKKTESRKVAVSKKTAQKPVAKKLPEKKAVLKKQPLKAQRKTKMIEKTDYDVQADFSVAELSHPLPSKKATTLLGALEFMPYQPKADEAYMSDLQREHFRKILAAWKQQLMQDVDLTVGHLKEEAVFYADPVDRASQEEGFNLELRTRDRERKLIKKIEQSLDLISTGEYGFCEDCGAEIGIRRLEARPTAVKCIDCKTFQEIREKQLGG